LRVLNRLDGLTRDSSKWFGGIDVHHVFFEGIHLDEDDVWAIHWGS